MVFIQNWVKTVHPTRVTISREVQRLDFVGGKISL